MCFFQCNRSLNVDRYPIRRSQKSVTCSQKGVKGQVCLFTKINLIAMKNSLALLVTWCLNHFTVSFPLTARLSRRAAQLIVNDHYFRATWHFLHLLLFPLSSKLAWPLCNLKKHFSFPFNTISTSRNQKDTDISYGLLIKSREDGLPVDEVHETHLPWPIKVSQKVQGKTNQSSCSP